MKASSCSCCCRGRSIKRAGSGRLGVFVVFVYEEWKDMLDALETTTATTTTTTARGRRHG